jgi:hypothetical protein
MLVTFLLLAVVQAGLSIWSRGQLGSFLSRHPSVQGTATFEEFKQLARGQMYGALVYLVLGVGSLLLSVALTLAGGFSMLLVVVAVNVPLLLLGMSNKKLEDRVRALQCSDPQLAGEFARVGESWMRKPLPDF